MGCYTSADLEDFAPNGTALTNFVTAQISWVTFNVTGYKLYLFDQVRQQAHVYAHAHTSVPLITFSLNMDH